MSCWKLWLECSWETRPLPPNIRLNASDSWKLESICTKCLSCHRCHCHHRPSETQAFDKQHEGHVVGTEPIDGAMLSRKTLQCDISGQALLSVWCCTALLPRLACRRAHQPQLDLECCTLFKSAVAEPWPAGHPQMPC